MASTQTEFTPIQLPRRRKQGSRRKVSDDDAELIIAAHLEGYPPWEIDEAMRLTPGMAERTLTNHGYKSRFRVPKNEYMQYPRLYMVERMSLAAIAEKFSNKRVSRSPGTIKVYLLMIGTFIDDDGKKRKIRIRNAGHRGKQGKRGSKRRIH